ncbi:MAG: tRNA 2-selenouridine(34) synthase MnmH [Candidatus Delongbacteria bacterium]|nr:tRNA 2-selenouridine(34) synthase MnmH [Candidatus Delongbacteria bacterium]MBN2835683.1 tRNA 2-selenouridine(34) synthase MnmH [Candidatus Delongbacteria bacterium]
MRDKRDRGELIQFIRSIEEKIDAFPNLYDHLRHKAEIIDIERFLDQYNKNDTLLIDARSSNEFFEDHILDALNFDILDNEERDKVGFLYTHYSQKAAEYLAVQFAEAKIDKLKIFMEKNKKANIVIYCWRGGGRSSALAHYLIELGYSVKKIYGGYKSYRQKIYDTLYNSIENYNFLVLCGMTGSGKTEILENLREKTNQFDIERSAGHASSLFGKVRFGLEETVKGQANFENNLFKELLRTPLDMNLYISESESKRIHRFQLPDKTFQHLLNSETILIDTPLESRAQRIVREYFKNPQEVYEVLHSSNFLRQIIGGKMQEELLQMIDKGNYYDFSIWFLKFYYDKRYANRYKNIIHTVDGKDFDKANDEVLSFYLNRATSKNNIHVR